MKKPEWFCYINRQAGSHAGTYTCPCCGNLWHARFIRENYSQDVPIIICANSGFADQKAYKVFEEDLDIHYITTGKIYKPTRNFTGYCSFPFSGL